jgi:hypothetical protein
MPRRTYRVEEPTEHTRDRGEVGKEPLGYEVYEAEVIVRPKKLTLGNPSLPSLGDIVCTMGDSKPLLQCLGISVTHNLGEISVIPRCF